VRYVPCRPKAEIIKVRIHEPEKEKRGEDFHFSKTFSRRRGLNKPKLPLAACSIARRGA